MVFKTAMRGKLLFSPHPQVQCRRHLTCAPFAVCGDSVPAPLPKGKNFLKKIFPLWTPLSKNFHVAVRLVVLKGNVVPRSELLLASCI